MQMKYRCCFCGKLYGWYQDVCKYEGEEFSTAITANSIMLKSFLPSPERNGEKQEVQEASGNLAGLIINLCPDCMRGLLSKCYPSDTRKWNCFQI